MALTPTGCPTGNFYKITKFKGWRESGKSGSLIVSERLRTSSTLSSGRDLISGSASEDWVRQVIVNPDITKIKAIRKQSFLILILTAPFFRLYLISARPEKQKFDELPRAFQAGFIMARFFIKIYNKNRGAKTEDLKK
jgi:hypothetical protein